MKATKAEAYEFVQRLLKLDIRDRFKDGFCRYCGGLCTPKERVHGRCPNCASMRRAMKEMTAPERKDGGA